MARAHTRQAVRRNVRQQFVPSLPGDIVCATMRLLDLTTHYTTHIPMTAQAAMAQVVDSDSDLVHKVSLRTGRTTKEVRHMVQATLLPFMQNQRISAQKGSNNRR